MWYIICSILLGKDKAKVLFKYQESECMHPAREIIHDRISPGKLQSSLITRVGKLGEGTSYLAIPSKILGRGRTGHFGVRWGQDQECVLKLSWPSTAEYRMMELNQKKGSSFHIADLDREMEDIPLLPPSKELTELPSG